MSEVKYKAVPCSGNNCDGCVNNTDNGVYECCPFIEARIKEGLPDCCGEKEYIYQLDTESNRSKLTVEQAREKFESHIVEELKQKRHDDSNRYYDFNTEQQWLMYWQALEDHDILEEGE